MNNRIRAVEKNSKKFKTNYIDPQIDRAQPRDLQNMCLQFRNDGIFSFLVMVQDSSKKPISRKLRF